MVACLSIDATSAAVSMAMSNKEVLAGRLWLWVCARVQVIAWLAVMIALFQFNSPTTQIALCCSEAVWWTKISAGSCTQRNADYVTSILVLYSVSRLINTVHTAGASIMLSAAVDQAEKDTRQRVLEARYPHLPSTATTMFWQSTPVILINVTAVEIMLARLHVPGNQGFASWGQSATLTASVVQLSHWIWTLLHAFLETPAESFWDMALSSLRSQNGHNASWKNVGGREPDEIRQAPSILRASPLDYLQMQRLGEDLCTLTENGDINGMTQILQNARTPLEFNRLQDVHKFKTPLMVAIESDNPAAVHLLLEAGASPRPAMCSCPQDQRPSDPHEAPTMLQQILIQRMLEVNDVATLCKHWRIIQKMGLLDASMIDSLVSYGDPGERWALAKDILMASLLSRRSGDLVSVLNSARHLAEPPDEKPSRCEHGEFIFSAILRSVHARRRMDLAAAHYPQQYPECPVVDVVRMLEGCGLDFAAQAKEGNNLLHAAVALRNMRLPRIEYLARFLLARIDYNLQDECGRVALHFATTAEVAAMLLEHGAPADAVEDSGRTPLHYADNAELAKILLRKGASVDCLDHEGRTALRNAVRQYARFDDLAEFQADRFALIKTLLDFGASMRVYCTPKTEVHFPGRHFPSHRLSLENVPQLQSLLVAYDQVILVREGKEDGNARNDSVDGAGSNNEDNPERESGTNNERGPTIQQEPLFTDHGADGDPIEASELSKHA